MEGTECIDPELIGNWLDLSRPELRPILDRYVSRSALIVGRQDASGSVKDALIEGGWRVRSCVGPGRARCPLPRGGPACYLRESAHVAVVYIDPTHTSGGSGLIPRLLCAADEASPAVLALEGRLDPPETTTRFGVVGALRSTGTILNTIAAVANRDPHVSRENQPE